MEINIDTKIAELLNSYEGMIDILILINSKFKKLQNPILRNTIAKVATIKQAAIIGGMEPIDLVNRIRKEIGQTPISISPTYTNNTDKVNISKIPKWIREPRVILNVNKLLNKELNPLSETNKILKKFPKDEILALKSDFEPAPLIDELKKRKYDIYCNQISKNEFITYIKKL